MQALQFTAKEPVVLHARVVTGTGGGPDKTILCSPRYLKRLGFRGLCAYLHSPKDPGFEALRKKAEQWQAPLVSIPDRGALDWRVIPLAMNVCRREKVAIWHGHDYKSNLLGLILSRFWRMGLITTVHGWVKHTKRTPLYYAIDRFCLPRYHSVLTVSEDLYQQSRECGVPEHRCTLIENAIDTEEFSRREAIGIAKDKLGLQKERFVIGAVGRLSPEKGFDLLIQACSRLLKEGVDLELLIVGEGDQEEELRALSGRLGCSERIHLLGYRSDIRPIYEAMDVFALSSLREGLPNVLLEAQALEAPVLSTQIAGVPRLIEDNRNGILIEPGSVDALSEGLSTFYRSPELRQRLAQSGRKVIEERYSFARRMEKIVDRYNALLNRATTNGSP